MTLDNKIKELIAIGASITANCQPCLQYHLNKAIEYGVTDDEIRKSIEVGKMVRRGAYSKMDKFAENILTTSAETVANKVDEDCGCGK